MKDPVNDQWHIWKVRKLGKKVSIISFVIILILLIVSAILDGCIETNILDGVVAVVDAMFPYWSILSAGVGLTGVADTVINRKPKVNQESDIQSGGVG